MSLFERRYKAAARDDFEARLERVLELGNADEDDFINACQDLFCNMEFARRVGLITDAQYYEYKARLLDSISPALGGSVRAFIMP